MSKWSSCSLKCVSYMLVYQLFSCQLLMEFRGLLHIWATVYKIEIIKALCRERLWSCDGNFEIHDECPTVYTLKDNTWHRSNARIWINCNLCWWWVYSYRFDKCYLQKNADESRFTTFPWSFNENIDSFAMKHMSTFHKDKMHWRTWFISFVAYVSIIEW